MGCGGEVGSGKVTASIDIENSISIIPWLNDRSTRNIEYSTQRSTEAIRDTIYQVTVYYKMMSENQAKNAFAHARNRSRNDFNGLDNLCLRLSREARRAAFSSTSVCLLARLCVRKESGLFSFSLSLSSSLTSSESLLAARELPDNEDLSDNPGVAGSVGGLNIELRNFTV
jgi:hypothetical protein